MHEVPRAKFLETEDGWWVLGWGVLGSEDPVYSVGAGFRVHRMFRVKNPRGLFHNNMEVPSTDEVYVLK